MTGMGSVGGKADVAGAAAVTKKVPVGCVSMELCMGELSFNAIGVLLIPGVN
jgi:hypothetical protein